MSRRNARQNGVRAEIAATAARMMAEDGIDDYAAAKRKAARQLGVEDARALPGNDEIEEALRAYQSIYQEDEHPERIRSMRRVALGAMQMLECFRPYLTGAVLRGTAGRYAEIELQLFPESAKEVEVFLLDRNIPYSSLEARRYAGDRPRDVTILSLLWDDEPVNITVHDPRDERYALKTSHAGRVIDRAGLAEVRAMVEDPAPDDDPPGHGVAGF